MTTSPLMMEPFFLGSLACGLTSCVMFSIPGFLFLLLLGFRCERRSLPLLLMLSPAFGLGVYGSYSLFVAYFFTFSYPAILFFWLMFCGVLVSFSRKFSGKRYSAHTIDWHHFFLLFFLYACWSLIPPIFIFPFIEDGGLYTGMQIHDHMKMALVDAIVREGLPPMNPFYAPGGQRIELIYYYGWHFLVAQLKVLTGMSAWQAQVAFSWFTSLSLISCIGAMAIQIGERSRAGFFIFLLAMCHQLPPILVSIAGPQWKELFNYPPGHPLEYLWWQLSWAPQHVFSALCVILLLYLATHLLTEKKVHWICAAGIGLVAATGFSASVWVSGVGLAFVLPALIYATRKYLCDQSRLVPLSLSLVLAVSVCVLFSLPVLNSIFSNPDSMGSGFPLTVKPYTSTGLFGMTTLLEQVGHVFLYWLKNLVLIFGCIYILGLLTLFAYKPQRENIAIFKSLSIAGIFGFFIIVQFLQSNIANNDFGWRCVVVPMLLLMIWSAVALSRIELGHQISTRIWHGESLLVQRANIILPLSWMLITLGIASSIKDIQLPGPRYSFVKKDLALHRDILRTKKAWEEIKQLTGPHDIVQYYPLTYGKTLTRGWAPAPLSLFGDRPTAYTDPESVAVFAHSYNKDQKWVQQKRVYNLFSPTPWEKNIKYAHDILKIKAILVDRRDPVWKNRLLEQSDYYTLVRKNEYYKIYLATDHESATTSPSPNLSLLKKESN